MEYLPWILLCASIYGMFKSFNIGYLIAQEEIKNQISIVNIVMTKVKNTILAHEMVSGSFIAQSDDKDVLIEILKSKYPNANIVVTEREKFTDELL